jgi:uncharacterized protein (TIGR03437 family)
MNGAGRPPVAELLKRPLVFEPNQGQAAGNARILSRIGHYLLSLRPLEMDFGRSGDPAPLRMRLEGGNPRALPELLDPLPGKSFYYLGNDPRRWQTGVPNYARVAYREVYPGIDLVLYGNRNELEYDLIVAPRAHLSRVCLTFEGAARLTLETNGDLRVETPSGALRQKRPVVYQEAHGQRRELAGRYVVQGRQVHFVVDGYDGSQRLVIDPALVYATFFGGTGNDAATGKAVDQAGNLYVTGFTMSADFPGTPQPTPGGKRSSEDVFVVKLDPTAQHILYSVILGGAGDDEARALAVDASGKAYITGSTQSSDFPTKNAYQPSHKGLTDAFVAKLDASGSLLYSTFLGGAAPQQGTSRNADDRGLDIAADPAGNAYVAGQTNTADFPVTTGTLNHVPVAGEAFVTEFGASGNLVFSTMIGGADLDVAYAIAVGSSGAVFVAGETDSTDLPVTAGVIQSKSAGDTEIWVARLNPAASSNAVTALSYLGGSGHERFFSMCVDGANNVYLAGETWSRDFPVTPGALQTKFTDIQFGSNTWFGKLNPTLTTKLFLSYFGSDRADAGLITLDGAGNVYLAGAGDISSLLTVAPNVLNIPGYNYPGGFLLRLKPDGTGIAAAWIGAILSSGAVLDSAGANLYLVGRDGPGPVTPGALQPAPRGIYLARVDLTPSQSPVLISKVNVAGGGYDIAQNTWVEIHGFGLAPATVGANGMTWSDAPEFASGRMPTQLGGVSVKVNGKSAYIYYVSPTQVNVLTPLDSSTGLLNIQLTNGSSTSDPIAVKLTPLAPTFLLFGGGPYIASVHADGSLVGPASMSVPGYAFTPAKPGETILLFGTGFGLPASTLTDGSMVQSGSLTNPPAIFFQFIEPYRLGSTYPAKLAYAGVISPGLYQFNVVVPAVAADGDYKVIMRYPDTTMAYSNQIAISR